MGKYVLSTAKSGDIMFNVKAGNGEVIATSQMYSSKDSAINGIESVRKNAPEAPVEDQTRATVEEQKCPKFEVYQDKGGEFRFRLKAGNGQTIIASEGYTAKSSCMNGIKSVRKNADSPIVDNTEPAE